VLQEPAFVKYTLEKVEQAKGAMEMARQTKKAIELWTIRNKRGQFIGCWRAVSAIVAMRACLDADAVTASQFRRFTRLRASDLVAAIENGK
jgi:hypothetical protein